MSKPWSSIDGQVQRFQDRGLNLNAADEAKLRKTLERSNYYRISGYSRLFLDPSREGEWFRHGTSLTEILQVYEDDAALRRAVFEGIQVVEVCLRQRIAHTLGAVLKQTEDYSREDMYLPVAGATPELGEDPVAWQRKQQRFTQNRDHVLKSIRRILDEGASLPLEHFRRTGEEVPVWVIVEEMTMGDLSKLISTWRTPRDIDLIVKSTGFKSRAQLEKAIGNMTFLRNLTAHHARIWNRKLSRNVALPGWTRDVRRRGTPDRSPAALIVLLAAWVDRIEETNSYSTYLMDVMHVSPEFTEGMYSPLL